MAVQFFEDIVVGAVEESGSFVANRADTVAYAQANDLWPIHVDQHFAEDTVFGDITASFGYVVSLLFRAVHTLPINQGSLGPAFLGALEWDRVRFRKAVLPDDRLRVRVTVVSQQLGRKGDRGTVTSRCEILNHHDDVVVDLDMVCLYRTENPGGPEPANT